MSPVLIILLFAGAVLLFVLYVILRAKVQQISLRAFGTRDIREGHSQAEREADDTPCSVSGGDPLYLPQILRDFPEFNRELAVSQIETCLRDVFSGIETGQAVEKPLYGPAVLSFVRDRIDDLAAEGNEVHFSGLCFHRTAISRYLPTGYDRTIRFQSAFEVFRSENGGPARKQQEKYQLDYTYTLREDGGAAAQVSLRCPHCGAPVSKIGEKICPYCGNGVVSPLSQTWRITNIQPCK